MRFCAWHSSADIEPAVNTKDLEERGAIAASQFRIVVLFPTWRRWDLIPEIVSLCLACELTLFMWVIAAVVVVVAVAVAVAVAVVVQNMSCKTPVFHSSGDALAPWSEQSQA